jgi:predicted nicotinamide N-methyase
MKNQMDDTYLKELRIDHYLFHIIQHNNTINHLDLLIKKGNDHPDVIDERIPYWLEIWPSAFVLSNHLIDRGLISDGVQSLELGCGIGLPSMVCKKMGGIPHLTDYTEEAMSFAEANWNINFNEPMLKSKMDWREPNTNIKYPILLASDVAYEKRSFEYLIKSFKSLVTEDGIIVMSEPSRKVAVSFIESLPYNGFEVESFNYQGFFEGSPYCVNVYELKLSPPGF